MRVAPVAPLRELAMLDPATTLATLDAAGVRFFTGVPDSLLKDFCAYVAGHVPAERHVIAANEGGAVALAAGFHLATGDLALVYLQNSGLGNAVNPLLSLADGAVYGIPMLLLIGWRGEPGRHDEPQHLPQGRATLPLLEAIGVDAVVLADEDEAAAAQIRQAAARAREGERPVALVVRAGTFAPSGLPAPEGRPYPMSREDAVRRIVAAIPADAVFVSTTGMTSRELFEYRVATGEDPGRDFLTVGSMGHASQIALGIALARPDRRVVCLDGDGAAIMHLGALGLIGSRRPRRLLHFVLNNGVHDSVGGQPSAGYDIDLTGIARASGYADAVRVDDGGALHDRIGEALSGDGPAFIEARIHPGARPDLGRPTSSPADNKRAFVARLRRA
jgi:phosphonopyruvate decarboxylase